MIVHALFRNLLLPGVIMLYALNLRLDGRLDTWFKYLIWVTAWCVPVYCVLALVGLNPIKWFVSTGWRSVWSPIEYLLFIAFTSHFVYIRSQRSTYSYAVAVTGAGVSGYLYEVPRWVGQGGWLNLFRTARNSLVVLDWGMLSIPILVYLLSRSNYRVSRLVVPSMLFYMFYCYVYYYHFSELFRFLVDFRRIPLILYFRIPAMLLTLGFVAGLHRGSSPES